MLKASRFLNPKADIVFKKVFGQHEHLLRSFLNAMIPLPDGVEIDHLEYLPSDQVPEIPEFKHTIVDVKCYDQLGRHFIVEMQMEWLPSFSSRILYGACKAYTGQLKKGRPYSELAPVYALGLLNGNFDDSCEYYHHYAMKHTTQPEKALVGLEVILVELQKFKPQTLVEKRLQALWIRFLNEAEDLDHIPNDFKEYKEFNDAFELVQESAYTPAELETYNKYWDSVSTEQTILVDSYGKGMAKGMVKGREEGRLEEKLAIARRMMAKGLSAQDVSDMTGLALSEIQNHNHILK
jgi:predicted transposase/invertase (TIGR01784 family)